MKLYQISPDGMQTLTERLQAAREGIDLGFFVNKRKPLTVDESGIARIHLYGPLMADAAPVHKELGSTDYADVAAEFATEGIRGVLLLVDSPGGTVAGAIELAKIVENAPFPVVSFISGCGCSAAYKVLAGCDYAVASPSASVGNIGCIMVVSDTTGFTRSLGIELDAITNHGADLKSTGHLDSLTDPQREFLQDSINECGEVFKAHVLTNRPQIDPEAFRAGWFSGPRAVSMGLVDEIGTEADALARLHELISIFDRATP